MVGVGRDQGLCASMDYLAYRTSRYSPITYRLAQVALAIMAKRNG